MKLLVTVSLVLGINVLLAAPAVAQAKVPSTVSVSSGAAVLQREGSNASSACNLPSAINVAFSDVTALTVGKPSAIISYGEDDLQFAELWLPESANNPSSKASSPVPLVIFIHGGCWLNQFDITHTHAFSTALAQAGYAVFSIEYRRTGDHGGGWPGSYNDIKAAISARSRLEDYDIDLTRVALTGHSAGGHLALLAGSEPNNGLSAVIGLAAIVDIAQYSLGQNSCQTATPSFMGGSLEARGKQYAAANPTNRQWHPTTKLLHGTADQIVPLSQSAGYPDQLILVDGAGHFDMVHPNTLAFKTFLKTLASSLK